MRYIPPHLLLLAVLTLLTACSRAAVTGVTALSAEGAIVQPVFIATQRSKDQLGPAFGARREEDLRFGRLDVSIPPGHKPGNLERVSGVADPAKVFTPVGVENYATVAQFVSAVRRNRAGDGGAVIFVPGYNNTLEDGAFRLAQVKQDFEINEPAILFSWLSAGDARGYVYDRDSVLFARDGFEELLRELDARGQKNILIVAHSMGGYLTMETLRQIAIKGDHRILDALEGVILMSPDIDPDVFRQQAKAIGDLPEPFLILTSRKDHILSLAGLLTGMKPRLGRIDSAEAVAGLDVTVLDLTELSAGEGAGHNVPFASGKAIKVLRGIDQQIRKDGGSMKNFVLQGRDRAPGLGEALFGVRILQ
ncbi:alpha/beta hydrolase [Rhodalgimonas zhirmunskyi]|nr:alpha/beta fold hydrolase [Rhodoalgimonas zhirmunskyi]